MEIEVVWIIKLLAVFITAGGLVFIKDLEKELGKPLAILLLLFVATLTISSLSGYSIKEMIAGIGSLFTRETYNQPTSGPYGAVVSHSTRFSFAYKADSLEAAKKSAFSNCNFGDCKLEAYFVEKQCFVLFRSPDGNGKGLGWAVDNGITAATKSASDECRKRNGKCEMYLSVCADGSNIYNKNPK